MGSGQVSIAQQAVPYGVKNFYGNAWSGPAFMKTNNNEDDGGYLCGVSSETCSSGGWKQAFANYLIGWTNYYASVGMNITNLGFLE